MLKLSEHKIYEFERFRLDSATAMLYENGEAIAIPPKAVETLMALIARHGEIIAKDELMSAIWTDSIVEESNLSQYIYLLRKRLGTTADGQPFIETLKRRGYRFNGDIATGSQGLSNTQLSAGDRQVDLVKLADGSIPADPRIGDVETYETRVAGTRLGTRNVYAIGLFILSVLAAFATGTYYFQGRTIEPPIDTIAILPFENNTLDPEAEYLSDGVTNSLINNLSQLSNLKVSSQSSVSRYRNNAQNTDVIGRELGVRSVLTGSIRRANDRLIINVRLDDVANARQLWGEEYVRGFPDILAVQEEIVRSVSANLRLKLDVAEYDRVRKRGTSNVEAYTLYLKGNHKWDKHTQADLQQAIVYYQQSIQKDPNYALAYCGLANSYGRLGNSYQAPHDNFPKARAYAEKALELDQTLAEAHTSLATVYLLYDWNWGAAQDEINRALQLDPTYIHAYDMNSVYLHILERHLEAIDQTRRAQELEPLSLSINVALGEDLYYAKRYDEAIAQLKDTVELDPTYYRAYLWLGHALVQKGMLKKAIRTYQDGMNRAQHHPQLVSSYGYANALDGDRVKASKALDELDEMKKAGYVSPYLFAVVHFGLRENEKAFKKLEEAFRDRSFWLIWLNADPRFDTIRSDERFQSMIRRIGLK
jgi:TolB-like protein/DNA-binding winged helix-turn-helix (wHTH) protein/Tfp pilus assembly protein PilF